jgi:hypothetical protein
MLDASATVRLAIPILFCTIVYEDPGSASARKCMSPGVLSILTRTVSAAMSLHRPGKGGSRAGLPATKGPQRPSLGFNYSSAGYSDYVTYRDNMLGHNSFEAMIMPDSQSLARLPCPIHDDDSGRAPSPEQRYPVVAVFGAAS